MHIDVNPIAFQIGILSVGWYGLFLTLAVVWLLIWVWWQIRKGNTKINVDTMMTMALVGVPSGIVFARLLHVADNIIIAKLHPELVVSGAVFDYSTDWIRVIGGSGLTAYGAVLGAALGVWIYCKIAKINIGPLFDMMAPAVLMAQAIGRVGCLLNGCCYGVPTTSFLGLEYTNPASAGFGPGFTQPTVLYEIIFCVIGFFVLLKLRGKFIPGGALFIVYLSMYSAWRVGIDFLRDGNPLFLGLHPAQVIALIVLCITVPWMIIKLRLKKNETGSLIPSEEVLASTRDTLKPAEDPSPTP
jgi:phosphatidylglycerol---prolipoprotein diacylglyceryl transferase